MAQKIRTQNSLQRSASRRQLEQRETWFMRIHKTFTKKQSSLFIRFPPAFSLSSSVLVSGNNKKFRLVDSNPLQNFLFLLLIKLSSWMMMQCTEFYKKVAGITTKKPPLLPHRLRLFSNLFPFMRQADFIFFVFSSCMPSA